MDDISEHIAYITINPGGAFLKNVQKGFLEYGIQPHHLIHVQAKSRLKKEFRKYKFGILKKFILPKFSQRKNPNPASSQNAPSSPQEEIPIKNKISVSGLNSDELADFIRKNKIKYLVNCGAGFFKDKIINIENLTIFNAHAGFLPKYRNMNVVEWAIFNGEKVIGTVHKIDKGIDTGAILLQEELDVSKCKNYQEARETAFQQVALLLGKTVKLYDENKIPEKSQKNDEGKNWYVMHSLFQNTVNKKLQKNP